MVAIGAAAAAADGFTAATVAAAAATFAAAYRCTAAACSCWDRRSATIADSKSDRQEFAGDVDEEEAASAGLVAKRLARAVVETSPEAAAEVVVGVFDVGGAPVPLGS